MIKNTLFTAVCGAVLAGCCLGGCKEKQAAPQAQQARPAQPVKVASVTLIDNIEHRRYSGLVSSPSVVKLVPRVSGELLEVGFKNGEYVSKDQVLYVFDRIRYEAAVKSAEAKIAECSAHLIYAQNNYSRTLQLHNSQAASKDSLENTLSALDAYKSAMLAAEAALITAQDDLKNTVIVAPMDGVIGVTNYTVGNYITPSSGTLVTINQVSPIRVQFSMSNRDFLQMFGSLDALKKEASITLKLADDSIFAETGSVAFIDNSANRNTDTIQIYAEFPNAKHILIPGSTVTVNLDRLLAKNCPAIAPSAIMHDRETAYVYVLDANNAVTRRNVTLGNERGKYIIITSGLQPGEKVVIDGTHKARPGDQVVPVIQED